MSAVLRDTVPQLRSRLIDCCLASSINYFMHFQVKLYKGSVVFHFTAIQTIFFLWMMFNNKLFDAFSFFIFSFSTLSPDGHLSLVYAINFQKTLGGNTVYTVYDGNSISTKFRIDNTGHLVTLTSLDYETDPTTFNLIIRAKDTHSELTSSVTVSCHSRLSLD